MKSAKWIWENENAAPDSYVRFFKTFESNGGKVSIELSSDSNYELYVNGCLAGFGQYADYPYHKVYDTIDITPYCQKGINRLSILVWYHGFTTLTYYKGNAGLIFSVLENGNTVAYSDATTLCKSAEDYVSGKQKLITSQLGFSYTYDCAAYDGCNQKDFLATEANGWHCATELNGMPQELYPRPNQKLVLEDFKVAAQMDTKNLLFDLGEETVGYLSLHFRAPKGTLVTVSYGEHLVFDENGEECVPRRIASHGFVSRDFSMELYASGDWFDFSNFMRRLGCRYLQIECDGTVELDRIGVYPTVYPLTVLPFDAGSELRQKIYEVAVKTLQCCMHEHFEDCPWREQALYTMDSRNQMLCSYYAFGEYQFSRASLELMCLDRREDDLLHISFPSDMDLVIPSFSLYWLLQMREYADASGDISLIQAYSDKMERLIDAFLRRAEDGVLPNFYGEKRYWNFYEWQPTLQAKGDAGREKAFDLILNALVSWMLQQLSAMLCMIDRKNDAKRYQKRAEELNAVINRVFWREEKGLYIDRPDRTHFSALGNSIAILCGAADGEKAKRIAENMLSDTEIVPTTLSMRAFLYDALIATDRNRYADWILADIDGNYSYMLDQGATSFWETLKGAKDFNNAGSLCHGWSAIPIVYYRLLL